MSNIIYCCYDEKNLCDSYITREEAESCCLRDKLLKANFILLKEYGMPEIFYKTNQYSYMLTQFNSILGITEEQIKEKSNSLTEPHVELKYIN